jgi:hypothetical protein
MTKFGAKAVSVQSNEKRLMLLPAGVRIKRGAASPRVTSRTRLLSTDLHSKSHIIESQEISVTSILAARNKCEEEW